MIRNITTYELDRIIQISKMNLNSNIISNKLFKIISYSELLNVKNNNNEEFNDKLVKAKKIYEYFKINGLFTVKDFYRCSLKEFNDKITRIEKIYDTCFSDISKEEKAKIIFGFYDDVNALKYDYLLFVKYGIGDRRLDRIKHILLNFDKIIEVYTILEKEPNLKSNVLYRKNIENHLEQTKYLDNYLYAKYVIELFISDDSLSKNEFYQKLEIDNMTFNYCVELIKFLDIELYKKYEQTILDNSINKNNRIKTNIDEIVNRVNTDVSFSILDFYKLVPFKEYEYNFVPSLLNFIISNYGFGSITYCTILNYLYRNGINNCSYVTEESLNSKTMIISGVKITPYIINIIFRYMKLNDLPYISNVYDIVLRMYIDNKIDVSELIQKEQSVENKSKLVKYKNPYNFIKK